MKLSIKFIIICLGIYCITHLYRLTEIPVFADEAIYIRWTQLIISDPTQYLFFPLNDGKTPLFVWLLVPFVKFLSDPLFAGRLLAVIIGGGQLCALTYLSSRLNKQTSYNSYIPLILITTPFWIMYHRFSLMDGLLTLFTTLSVIGIWKFQTVKLPAKLTVEQYKSFIFSKSFINSVLCFAIPFSLAIYTKLPALLLIPSFTWHIVCLIKKKKDAFAHIVAVSAYFLFSALLFGLLAFHPAFPQLFSRGSDFLLSFSELMQRNIFSVITSNSLFVLRTFTTYLSIPLVIVMFITPFISRQRTSIVFLVTGMLFIVPLLLLAKVLHSRYLLPALPFFTLSLAESLLYIQNQLMSFTRSKLITVATVLCIFIPTIYSSYILLVNPEQALWTKDDSEQYFTDWSSGHGVKEITNYILVTSKTTSIAVATEGYFGTLPDGILMYTFNQNQEKLYIEGVGQPVEKLEGKFLDRAPQYDKHLLVVNNFRMKMNLPSDMLIAEFCRPQKPDNCLQLWNVNSSLYK